MKHTLCLVFLFVLSQSLKAETETERVNAVRALAKEYTTLLPKARENKEAADKMREITSKIGTKPAPKDCNYAKALAGNWRSPRHDYLYKADGTWSMLPAEEDATRGFWKLDGNRLAFSYAGRLAETKGSSQTLILVDADYFIYNTDDVGGPYILTRIR